MALPHGYEMVIGLEVHAQVNTNSKLFSASSVAFGAEPNTQANEIDLGMPGMLPVLNHAAVDAGIKLGLAIDAEVAEESVFARKNYFYPDLPKGYQISQFELPIVVGGQLEIEVEGPEGKEKRVIGITRMHLEEDAGKSIHDMGAGNVSYVDLNRAGVPLMEIVSEPDLRTPEEAGAYLKKLRNLVRFLDICDGDMEKGNFRCDANVSVRKAGEAFRTRCEIKNLNSVRHVMHAIAHEADRQIEIYEAGGEVSQETRLWDPDANETRTLRSKEDAHDYRYFPDPDLLPLRLEESRIEAIRATMPKLPDAIADELVTHGLSDADAAVIVADKDNVTFYEAMLVEGADVKLACNWMIVELFGVLNREGKEIAESPISATQLAALVKLISSGEISGKIAKTIFAEMLENGGNPAAIVAAKGLAQNSDEDELLAHIQAAIAAQPETVEKYKATENERLLGAFVGHVMKATKGQANPGLVNRLLLEELAKR
ncbi:MAG: Asp-tRNA(Asn)/Glu-tRNA(Gln) amidotransferase GatCAB subunit B [Alphaproteobacteria bacterium CG_4_10_14_0_8_um_filter_53_9]|nr:MAG: Asp-tRNA(Asn)/Glu-tRNA(Gln) amidotransferase GatCAB subunit B [Alphaproteobacteria bacterium CG_4_10_14_0_8_um_filter_53_9]